MKNYWKALLSLIASAILYQLVIRFIPNQFSLLIELIWLIIMILFGYFLAPNNRKNNRWFGKVIISIVVMFIVGYRLDLIAANEFRNLLAIVGLTNSFLDLLLIYCGWAFFQV